jgi:hypothetical protein
MNRSRIRLSQTCIAMLLAGSIMSPIAAHAQTDPGAAQPPTGETAGQVPEIIVTAQRREQRLQDVPLAISAIGAEQLADRGVTDIRQWRVLYLRCRSVAMRAMVASGYYRSADCRVRLCRSVSPRQSLSISMANICRSPTRRFSRLMTLSGLRFCATTGHPLRLATQQLARSTSLPGCQVTVSKAASTQAMAISIMCW